MESIVLKLLSLTIFINAAVAALNKTGVPPISKKYGSVVVRYNGQVRDVHYLDERVNGLELKLYACAVFDLGDEKCDDLKIYLVRGYGRIGESRSELMADDVLSPENNRLLLSAYAKPHTYTIEDEDAGWGVISSCIAPITTAVLVFMCISCCMSCCSKKVTVSFVCFDKVVVVNDGGESGKKATPDSPPPTYTHDNFTFEASEGAADPKMHGPFTPYAEMPPIYPHDNFTFEAPEDDPTLPEDLIRLLKV
ncbi:hypothetical protein [Crucian carp herpesvirus]|uniref:Membrane ORF126 n=1 Tax=Cyprinid herpesvirus 2 TaxID=317878 RepID=K7PC14_CYHV2|nr:membrane protein ORF126 [Cyprinid herpesvirus 2]APB92966.1 hypothetical protein [Crucian carp herpesvirus]AFJ20548.1 membrane protein ORF126 [Cyprinid herpesvirus 2]AKC02066.1 hypothetical protein [Cyprinid herpesvirus 2]AMB21692.1 membrane ORF126 [Cyprinid herpesvirus 2]QAU54845.1 membrane protein ORF126 [Cyprinid herpesvirus 2]